MASGHMSDGPEAKRPRQEEADPVVAGTRPFLVERFFAKHEFTAEYMLGSSDAEAWSVAELLGLAAIRGDKQAAVEWASLGLGYTESPGHPELRKLIAEMYGGPIGPDQVICLVPEEAIFISMSTLLSPHDLVVAMMPSYQSLYEIAKARGCTVKPWWGTYTSGKGWTFELDGLRKALAEGAAEGGTPKMLITNFPHNPTSWMPTADEHAALVSVCREHSLLWFSDEMYWGLADERCGPTESSCTRYEHALTLSGLSKPYGLPGLRVGWVATQDKAVMAKLCHMKDYVTICGSAPSETLAIIGMRHREALLARARETSQRNREHMKAFCEEFSDIFEWAPEPSVGLTAFVTLRGWAAEKGAQGFADWCVEKASCVFVPSDCFDMAKPPAVRFGLGRLNFPEALAQLRKSLLVAKADSS